MRFIQRFREWLEYRRESRRSRREYRDERQANVYRAESERIKAPYGRSGGDGGGGGI